MTDLRSGTDTPIPQDALPSFIATSTARKERRNEQKEKRLFPTINYAPRVSSFDPKAEHADFTGFFVLFWIGLAIMVFTTMLRNMKETGRPFSFRQWDRLTANIWELAGVDAVLSASTFLVLPLHHVFKKGGFLAWEKGGMWVQSAFQLTWLSFWTVYPFLRDWSWTAQVFLTLHMLALFMKMHSYAFYNGHLATTLRRLNALDSPAPKSARRAVVRYPSSYSHIGEIGELQAQAGELPADKRSSVEKLREQLALELVSPMGGVTYPQNLTAANFMEYLCMPTLCYEIEYPRLEKRSYMEIFYKTLAVFGCVFLLTIISDEFIIPTLDESAILLKKQEVWTDAALVFAETVSRLLFPFMIIFLLVFLVIFEYVCGAFAEITRRSDS